ncbi:MAG TPA: DUF309 domain-containing protein [Candidatus Polarisedimenticolia bacterium]|nr:DUF309 domain-containing protein [Candidatus Polarisedimenticolia bacterium]
MYGRLTQGVSLFNSGLFFEAHEAFEDLWREEVGDTRLVYQGLVQVCAGFVKLQRGQPGAARVLMAKGLLKLEAAPRECWPPLLIADLSAQVREAIRALDQGAVPASPVLRVRDD